MRRALSIFLAAVSFLIFIAACALWVRSYYVSDCLYWNDISGQGDWTIRRSHLAISGTGGIGMRRLDSHYQSPVSTMTRYLLADVPFEIFERDNQLRRPQFHSAVRPGYPVFRGFENGELANWGFKFGRLSLHEGYPPYRWTYAGWEIVIPYWALALLSGALPARWIWNARLRRTRTRIGLCTKCGYDLRGTPDRCPECGTVPRIRGAPADSDCAAKPVVSIKRRALEYVALLSLLLLLAICVVWVRSYWWADSVEQARGSVSWRLSSDAGALTFVRRAHLQESPYLPDAGWLWSSRAAGDSNDEPDAFFLGGWRFAGLARSHTRLMNAAGNQIDIDYVAMPYWFLTTLTIVAPGIWSLYVRRRWRSRNQARDGVTSSSRGGAVARST